MANADRDRTVSQKANTAPLPLRVQQTNIASQMLTAKKQLHTKLTLTQFPLRVRRHHAAFEGTQPRVVATADDPCFGIGCQPVRLHSLSEGQDLEGHHFTPGPRLNGGVVGAAWAPAGMAVARTHTTRYDVLPVPSVFPGVVASRFLLSVGVAWPPPGCRPLMILALALDVSLFGKTASQKARTLKCMTSCQVPD